MSVLIQPYDTAWPAAFAALKLTLQSALEGEPISIEHVGSTAIPGLPAKPVLDIDIVLEEKRRLSFIANKLQRLGYTGKGDQGIAGRYAFRQKSAHTPSLDGTRTWPDHHLYVCFADSTALKNHLLFRNKLLEAAGLRVEYAQLKLDLAGRKGITRASYATLKTDFILNVLQQAGMPPEELATIEKANKAS